jgi:phage repressor protein C with HTH and peptisase S24 domain
MDETVAQKVDLPPVLKGKPAQIDAYRAIATADEAVRPSEIAEKTGRSVDSTNRAVGKLKDADLITKIDHGLYTLPDDSHTSNVSKPTSPADDLTELFQDDVELDVYTEIKVEGGSGRVVYPDQARKKVTVPRQFISKIIGFVPPKQVGMMMVDGDSMHPTIQEDDMVLWRPVEEVRGGGVYVLSIDGGLVVKRVHKIPGGGLELISDNDYHGYPDYTIVPSDGGDELVNEDTGRTVDLQPVGKVIFPRRDTDRMHVKQVAEIVRSVANGDVDPKSLS